MGSEYHLTEKGRKSEPKNPAGAAVLSYIKEGHNPVNAEEIKQMVPGASQGDLDSLAGAGFLEKEGGGSDSGHITMGSGSGHYELHSTM